MLAGCLAFQAAAWDMPLSRYSQRHNFEKRLLSGPKKDIKAVESAKGGKAMSITLNSGSTYAYGNLKFVSGKPGTLTVAFDCKWVNPAGKNKLTLTANFRAPGKGNGSARCVPGLYAGYLRSGWCNH